MQESEHYIFISYENEDRELIQRLCKDLSDRDIPVWSDQQKLHPGEKRDQAVGSAVAQAGYFLCCYSQARLSNPGSAAHEEEQLAMEVMKTKPAGTRWFIPILLDGCTIPETRISDEDTCDGLHWFDLSGDWNHSIEQLVDLLHPSDEIVARIISVYADNSLERLSGIAEELNQKKLSQGQRRRIVETILARPYSAERAAFSRAVYHVAEAMLQKELGLSRVDEPASARVWDEEYHAMRTVSTRVALIYYSTPGMRDLIEDYGTLLLRLADCSRDLRSYSEEIETCRTVGAAFCNIADNTLAVLAAEAYYRAIESCSRHEDDLTKLLGLFEEFRNPFAGTSNPHVQHWLAMAENTATSRQVATLDTGETIRLYEERIARFEANPVLKDQAGVASLNYANYLRGVPKQRLAIEYYDRAISLLTGYNDLGPRQWLTQALLNKGAVLLSMSQFRKALECFEQAIRQAEGQADPAIRVQLAMAFAEKAASLCSLHKYRHVLPVTEQMEKTFAGDTDGEISYWLAVAFYNAGVSSSKELNREKARDLLSRALEHVHRSSQKDVPDLITEIQTLLADIR